MGRLYFLASDIEESLKLNAAFNLDFPRLLAEVEIAPVNLTSVRLTGAVAGNISLAGAMLLAADSLACLAVLGLLAKIRAIGLTSEPEFHTHYLERMTFAHAS